MSRNKPDRPRVFCIGWHKTGTSTMGLALLELGYTVLGARLDMAEPLLAGDMAPALAEAGKYDALQDVPWAALFRELDQAYPGSKFILTTREEDKWLNSAVNHFSEYIIPLHEWLYGKAVIRGNETIYLDRYREHYAEVETYFAERPQDLLIMDLAEGDGWAKLCPFLDEAIPPKKFPYANKGKHNYNWKDWLLAYARKMVPKSVRKTRVAFLEKLGLHKGNNRFNNAINKKYMGHGKKAK